LETLVAGDGSVKYQCRSSEVLVQKISEYIETDQCVQACGVDRNMIGISSDALLEPQVTAKLCSPACYNECTNIIDLYFNLAAGEGKNFSELSEKILKRKKSPCKLVVKSTNDYLFQLSLLFLRWGFTGFFSWGVGSVLTAIINQ
jgi:hypothetical protein